MSRVLVRLLLVLAATLVSLGLARTARAGSSAMTVELYTIGPSDALPSRFGHSLLCVRPPGEDAPEHGHCYDYGVADRDDLAHMIWTAVRGTPSFAPVKIGEATALAFFKGQGRQIERQRVPLAPDEAGRLVAAMDEEVRERRAYAYHPYTANCATKLRDHLDAASGGRLRPGPSHIPPGTFREYMEEGHSGRVGILTAMALWLGEGSDRVPSPWEAMLLPAVLRDGVAERFEAPPEQLEERLAVVLPTSRSVGRLALFAFAVALSVVARVAVGRGRPRLVLAIVGGALGLIALSSELFAALVTWREATPTWSLALFLPTDLALPLLTGRRLTVYLKARVAMAGLFALLEIAGVVREPMLPLAALVALPMLGVLSALREREQGRERDEGRPMPTTTASG